MHVIPFRKYHQCPDGLLCIYLYIDMICDYYYYSNCIFIIYTDTHSHNDIVNESNYCLCICAYISNNKYYFILYTRFFSCSLSYFYLRPPAIQPKSRLCLSVIGCPRIVLSFSILRAFVPVIFLGCVCRVGDRLLEPFATCILAPFRPPPLLP